MSKVPELERRRRAFMRGFQDGVSGVTRTFNLLAAGELGEHYEAGRRKGAAALDRANQEARDLYGDE